MKRKQKRSKKTIRFNFFIPIIVLAGLLFVYTVYFLISFVTIKTDNPLSENLSEHRILARKQPDVDMTMIVFEKGNTEGTYISDIYVSMVNRKKGISSLIYIPGTLHIPISDNPFGESLQISSLGYAGDFFQEGRGVEYTVWQLGEVLGFRPNNYIWVSNEANSLLYDIYGEGRIVTDKEKSRYKAVDDISLSSSFFTLHELSLSMNWAKTFTNISKLSQLDEKIYSNFSFSRILTQISSSKNLSSSTEVYSIDLGSSSISEEAFSNRGGVIKRLNVNSYDKALRGTVSKLIPKDLERERVRVEVYNASGLAGKALLYSRKIQNAGLEVVRFETAPGSLDVTEVYIADIDEFKNSYNVISEILLDRFDRVEGRPAFMTTGDIVIILGKDISTVDLF